MLEQDVQIYKDGINHIRKMEQFTRTGDMPVSMVKTSYVLKLLGDMRGGLGFVSENLYDMLSSMLEEGIRENDNKKVSRSLGIIAETIENGLKTWLSENEKSQIICLENYHKNVIRIMSIRGGEQATEKPRFTGRGCVYSAITGKYDDIVSISNKEEDLDYIFFTDNTSIESDQWQVRYLDNPMGLSPFMLAKRVKLMPFEYLPEYDYTIWIDGNLDITGNIHEIINDYSRQEPMLCFSHNTSLGIIDEAQLIIELGKADPQKVISQVEAYVSEGYPTDMGAILGGFMVRDNHDESLKMIMKYWWDEICNKTGRDQLSFGYVAWKYGFLYDLIPVLAYDGLIRCYSHNQSKGV